MIVNSAFVSTQWLTLTTISFSWQSLTNKIMATITPIMDLFVLMGAHLRLRCLRLHFQQMVIHFNRTLPSNLTQNLLKRSVFVDSVKEMANHLLYLWVIGLETSRPEKWFVQCFGDIPVSYATPREMMRTLNLTVLWLES